MNQTPSLRATSALTMLLLLVPAIAQAHPGHDASGLVSGALHPFLGWDHILAMVAVGVWAVQLGRSALWAAPLAFVGMMGVGAVAGMNGFAFPLAESGIVLSVLTFGLLIAAAVRLPLFASLAITAIFALCHGFAHGAEMPAASAQWSYVAGFAISTVILHGCGIVAGLFVKEIAQAQWLRFAGAAICVSGMALLAS